MGMHPMNSLCPVCSKDEVVNIVDMTGQEKKYICPMCGGCHYGEPEGTDLHYTCAKCKETSDWVTWVITDLKPGEHVRGAIEVCLECNAKFEGGKVAFIEIEDGTTGETGRTGHIWFGVPPDDIQMAIGAAKMLFIEKAVLAKFAT